MSENDLMDLAVLERRKYNYLNEVLDLTKQLGEVMERRDEKSAKMVVAMRQDPILRLQEVDQVARERRESLKAEQRERVTALLAGAEPKNAGERTFQEQAGQARRLLERVVELDRRISLRLAGEDSFYNRKEGKK